MNNDIRSSKEAIQALQQASEDYLIKLFKDTQVASLHRKRETIAPQDLALVRYMRGDIEFSFGAVEKPDLRKEVPAESA